MDRHTRNNWRKIKIALEAAGLTDSLYYKRAVVICKGGKDPLNHEDVRLTGEGDA